MVVVVEVMVMAEARGAPTALCQPEGIWMVPWSFLLNSG